MKKADDVTKKELKELLSKGWITHDAMWFYHCMQEFGIERANELNIAAIRSMAGIEINRIKKVLGAGSVNNSKSVNELLLTGFELIKPDFMKFDVSFVDETTIRWSTTECFAYEGVKRIGAGDTYQCGIVERIIGWIEGLGVDYSLTPVVDGCMMNTQGRCERTVELSCPN